MSTGATSGNCVYEGEYGITDLNGVGCADAQAVMGVSPPGRDQNYQPFDVPGLGTWETQDQMDGGQQPYKKSDGSASFMAYTCERYPDLC